MSVNRNNQKISNQSSGGGNKKQGLAPNATNFFKANFTGRQYSTDSGDGKNRFKLVCMNQLGGIGRGRSQFGASADGLNCPLAELGYKLDPTFGPNKNGIHILDYQFILSDFRAVSLSIDDLNNIILSGSNNEKKLFIAKILSADGSLDQTFGKDMSGATIPIVSVEKGIGEYGYALYGQSVFDSSYNILQISPRDDGSFNYIRYKSDDGYLDLDFSNNGIAGFASIDINDSSGILNAIAFDKSNNKTILCGNDSSGSVLARFNMDGLIDMSFGINQDGIVKQDLSNNYSIFDMNLDSQNRIVLLGGEDGSNGIYVARYSTSGVLDQTWGGIGGGGISGEVYFNDRSGMVVNVGSNMIAFDNNDNILILNISLSYTPVVFSSHVTKLDANSGTPQQIATITPPNVMNMNTNVVSRGICFDKSNNKFLLNTFRDSGDGEILTTSIRRYTSAGNLDTTFCPSCTPSGVLSYISEPTDKLVPYDINIDGKRRIIVCGSTNLYPYVARFVKA